MKIYEGKDAWKAFELKDNEMEFRLLNLGSVDSLPDKTYEFGQTGRKLDLAWNSFFGVEYVLCSNEEYEVDIEIEIHFPDLRVERKTIKIKTNTPEVVGQDIPDSSYVLDGKWKIKLHVPKNIITDDGETVSVINDFQEEFEVKFYRPKEGVSTEDDINEIEALYNTKLNEDYKAYLRTYNGFAYNWWVDPDLEEIEEEIGFDEMIEMVEHIKDDKADSWHEEVSELFGGIKEEYSSLISMDGKPYDNFYDVRFGPFFYPIGVDEGGNPMVQIASGKKKGQVAMIDHERYHDGMDRLLELTEENKAKMKVTFDNLETVDTDTLVDYCEKFEYMDISNETFGAYFKRRDMLCELKREEVLSKYEGDDSDDESE